MDTSSYYYILTEYIIYSQHIVLSYQKRLRWFKPDHLIALACSHEKTHASPSYLLTHFSPPLTAATTSCLLYFILYYIYFHLNCETFPWQQRISCWNLLSYLRHTITLKGSTTSISLAALCYISCFLIE